MSGIGESGCGLEAQLESAYRFLSQPDPWASVKLDQANQAAYVGVDDTLLAQRKAFLRPDSLVVVVMLTDEDDSSAEESPGTIFLKLYGEIMRVAGQHDERPGEPILAGSAEGRPRLTEPWFC